MVTPQELGFAPAALTHLRVEDAQDSARIVRAVLAGEPGPTRDIVLMNAGAALYAAEVADSVRAGIDRARAAIDSGEAQRRLDGFLHFFARD